MVAVDNLQNLCFVKLSILMAFTSTVISHSLQIVNCCWLSALDCQKCPCSMSFPIWKLGPCSEGVMLAIHIASI
jgi:hypothetical protein